MPRRPPPADPALRELCSRWSKPLRKYLQYRGVARSCDIDDVAQETFLRLLHYSPGTKIADPRSYLYRVACNVANEWRERCVRRMPHEAEALEQIECDQGACPESIVEQEKRDQLVRAAIEHLPPRSRQVIELQVYSNLTYPQIAQQLGITYRMVLRALTRGHATLRMVLSASSR